jgi:DNA ligase D-like protein (predicted polymerase)
MGGRPVLLQRFPEGAGGPSFFQKRVPKNVPDWLQTTTVSTPNGTTSQALVAADLDHVLWAVNLGCLGFHVWPYLAADPDHTDELRIDLDPTPGIDFSHIRQAAHELQVLFAEVGIAGYPKTTGNRGLHVYVRLLPRWDSYQVRSAAVAIARELERRRPDLITAAWWKEERGQRVHRLQPECAAQDGLWRVVGAGPAGCPGLHANHLGRDRRDPSRSIHDRLDTREAREGR